MNYKKYARNRQATKIKQSGKFSLHSRQVQLLVMLVVLPLAISLGLWFTTHKMYYVFLGANLFALICFAIDKYKAKYNKWRFREADLILLCLLFPFGSLLGIAAFRHKSTKWRFWLSAAFAAVLQAALNFYWRWEEGARTEAVWTIAVMATCVLFTAGREIIIRLK